MEAGRKLFELKEVSVDDVVEEAVESFAPLRDRHPELDFAVDVEAGLPAVSVDVSAMVDAIGNLLSNAVKYGGVPPRVRLHVRGAPHGVAFEVTDNGEGIPQNEHRRIFGKFYRIDDRLSRERDGSGLGLAIVKHVVRAHNGRVQVESERGQGSTFRIELPTPAVPRAQRISTAPQVKGA
jgi:two-component system phosphate regulon sensor histidine kinase PhoR